MLAKLDRLELVLEIAKSEGIDVRKEWLRGIRGGLVRLGQNPILFVDESLSVSEQFDSVRRSLSPLDWSETERGEEMLELLAMEPVDESIIGKPGFDLCR
jgi:hypothetical protein